MYLILTWQHREILSEQSKVDAEDAKGSESEIAHLKFLTHAYKAPFFWFEVLECVRRLALASIIGIVSERSAAAAVLGTVISGMFTWVSTTLRPFKEISDNTLGVVLAYSLQFFFISALLIKVEVTQDDDDRDQDIFAALLIICLFAGPIAICIAVCSEVLSSNLHEEEDKERNEGEVDELETTIVSGTGATDKRVGSEATSDGEKESEFLASRQTPGHADQAPREEPRFAPPVQSRMQPSFPQYFPSRAGRAPRKETARFEVAPQPPYLPQKYLYSRHQTSRPPHQPCDSEDDLERLESGVAPPFQSSPKARYAPRMAVPQEKTTTLTTAVITTSDKRNEHNAAIAEFLAKGTARANAMAKQKPHAEDKFAEAPSQEFQPSSIRASDERRLSKANRALDETEILAEHKARAVALTKQKPRAESNLVGTPHQEFQQSSIQSSVKRRLSDNRNKLLMRSCIQGGNWKEKKAILDEHFREEKRRGDDSWTKLVSACNGGHWMEVQRALDEYYPVVVSTTDRTPLELPMEELLRRSSELFGNARDRGERMVSARPPEQARRRPQTLARVMAEEPEIAPYVNREKPYGIITRQPQVGDRPYGTARTNTRIVMERPQQQQRQQQQQQPNNDRRNNPKEVMVRMKLRSGSDPPVIYSTYSTTKDYG